MSAKPTEYPRWADTGSAPAANITDPPSGNKDTGWVTDEVPPSSWFNWFQQNVYKWVQYLDGNLNIGETIGPWTVRGDTGAAQGGAVAFASSLGEIGRLVALGGTADTNSYWSDDLGLTWTAVANNGGGATLGSVAWNGTNFTAVGTANQVCTSPDGKTWTSQTGPHVALALSSITWSATNSLWACGISNGKVGTSPTGAVWTEQTTGLASAASSVVWSPELLKFCASAAGAAGTSIATSANGTAWTLHTVAGGMGAVQYAPFATPIFLAFDSATAKTLYTSPDGITWTSRFVSTTTTYIYTDGRRTAWDGLLFLMGSGSNNAPTLVSFDGVTWTQRPNPLVPAKAINGLCAGANGSFVSIGSDHFAYISLSRT